MDLDYSIEGDFESVGAIKTRMDNAISKTFSTKGLMAFDTMLVEWPELRPGQTMHDKWGGYQYTFKLIPKRLAAELNNDFKKMQGQAAYVTPELKRTSSHRSSKVIVGHYRYIYQ